MPPETKAEAKAGQTTINAMVAGLDPSQGRNWFEKLGPGAMLTLYVVAVGLLAFDVIPNPDIVLGMLALLGPSIGGMAGRLGAK